jgi:DNA-binding NtrC family response regulator
MVTIFIVEDDQSLQRLYELILKETGFEIIDTAINGKEPIEKFNKLEVKPNIILMDHRMPIKNGLDAMTEILQTRNHAKIIFTSADMSVKEKAMSLGAYAFLDKPFRIQQLLITIQNIANELILNH